MPVPLRIPHTHVMRGNAVVKEQGRIVETYQVGKSTVHIMDTYFAKSEQEVENILDEMHEVVWQIVQEDEGG